MGYEPKPEQLYGSAYVTAKFLEHEHPEIKEVRVVGHDSIKHELAEVGIKSEGGQDKEDCPSSENSIYHYRDVKLNENVQAVIAGIDFNFTYHKLMMATAYLQHGTDFKNPGKFFATNNDAFDNVVGYKLPGAGAIVSAIMTALNDEQGAQRTEPPTICGKPNPFVINLICKEHGIK